MACNNPINNFGMVGSVSFEITLLSKYPIYNKISQGGTQNTPETQFLDIIDFPAYQNGG